MNENKTKDIQEIKEKMEKLSDDNFTSLIMERALKKFDSENFNSAELIFNVALVTERLIKLELITEERGLRIAEHSAKIMLRCADKNKSKN